MRNGSGAPWLYRVLARLYPAEFRREFGREIEREVESCLAEAAGPMDRLRVWRRAIMDLAISIAREQWDARIGERRPLGMTGILMDVHRSVRGLLRTPGVTVASVMTLALGIGATTVIFSVVHGVLLAPLPYPDPDRIVVVTEQTEGTTRALAISYVNAQDWKASQSTMEALALLRGGALTLTGADGAEQLSALFVDAEYFDVLGLRASLGRLFGREENRIPGGHPVAVLSNEAWQRLSGGDPAVVGSVLDLSGTPFTVVGVLSADYRDPYVGVDGGANDIIVPAMMIGQIDPQGNDVLTQRRRRTFGGIGKLRPGVSAQQADAELKRIAARMEDASPINRGMSAAVVPFAESASAGIRRPALTLLGGAIVLLIIACFNVANLLLVRGASRVHEFAVQIALGARRSRLHALLTVEGVLLALAGGALGILIAYASLPLLLRLIPTQLPNTSDVTISMPVLLAAISASLGAGIASGLVPALRHGRADLKSPLSGAARTVGDRLGGRLSGGLVLLEIATATILLATSALLIRSFRDVTSADPGFVTENVLTLGVSLPAATYADGPALAAAAQQLVERIGALPGIEWAQPWGPGRPGLVASFQTSVPDEMLIDEISDAPLARRHSVGPGALEDMGLSLIRGRTIAPTDDADAPRVAVISESMAAELWPGEDPIGKRYHNFQPPGNPIPEDRHWTVIGVVRDANHGGRVPFPGGIVTRNDSYFAFAQRSERSFTLAVRTVNAPDIRPIREAVRAFDPNIPIFQVATMRENFAQEESAPRFAAELMGGFGIAALLLAALGVYGVVSFTVAQREREIGLRTALGADPRTTVGQFLTYGLKLAGSGVVLGSLAAWAAVRGLQTVVPGVPDVDGLAVATASGALVLVALASCLIPALRATRIPPVIALQGSRRRPRHGRTGR